jgi:hypothetical protein
MSINPLNDISRVYLEHVATQEVEIEEGMTLKDYKKKRSALKQKEKRAADKISPGRRVGIHEPKYSPERAARHRANVDPDFEGNDERNYPGGKLKNPKKIRKAKALGELGESSHLETDMKKRQDANEKAIADMKKTKAHKDMVATVRKKFDEEYVDEALRSREERMARMVTPAKRKEQERTRQGRAILADIQATEKALKEPKTSAPKQPTYDTPAAEVRKLKPGQKKDTLALKAKRAMGEALDPVGKEDADVDNDGKKGTNADKYLLKRRKAIGKAISTQEAKEVKRWWDDDGDGKGYEEGEVSGKFKKKKSVKEGFSNWRQELIEVADVIEKEENDKEITEKKVKNKIKINPNIGEAIEEIGGTLLEMVEIDEMDYILESVYDELLEEGYEEDDIEEAIEYSLTEAKVTLGHDTAHEKKKSGLLSAAKSRLSSLKKSAKQAVASGARKVAKGALGVARKMEGGDKTPSAAQTKTRKASTYRGAGVGQKERVSSGSYTPPTQKKTEPVSDPWEGSATTPKKSKVKVKPKVKTTKVSGATPKSPVKKKRTSKLDDLLASVRNEEVQIDEKVLSAAETKKKEELVKSMKKSAVDFEKRYPGRGKDVMYATATKMAKRMAEQALEMQPKTQATSKPDQQQKKLQQNQDRMKQQEVQILQRKLQALRSAPKGIDPSITAGYEPEGELVSERTRYAKETGKNVKTGRPSEEGGNPQIKKRVEKEPWLKYGGSRQTKKVPGKKPPKAGEAGSGVQDPAHKVALRRTARELNKQQRIGSRFD